MVGPEDGNFAIWVGTLISNDSTYLIVNESGKDGETLQRMARIGYTKVTVYVHLNSPNQGLIDSSVAVYKPLSK